MSEVPLQLRVFLDQRRLLPPYKGTSFTRKCPPVWDHHRTLGIVPRQDPGRGVFLMSEVPLYDSGSTETCFVTTTPPAPSVDPEFWGVGWGSGFAGDPRS